MTVIIATKAAGVFQVALVLFVEFPASLSSYPDA
jgi:hypothetical protein